MKTDNEEERMMSDQQPANNPFGRHHGIHQKAEKKHNHRNNRRERNHKDKDWEGVWEREE